MIGIGAFVGFERSSYVMVIGGNFGGEFGFL